MSVAPALILAPAEEPVDPAEGPPEPDYGAMPTMADWQAWFAVWGPTLRAEAPWVRCWADYGASALVDCRRLAQVLRDQRAGPATARDERLATFDLTDWAARMRADLARDRPRAPDLPGWAVWAFDQLEETYRVQCDLAACADTATGRRLGSSPAALDAEAEALVRACTGRLRRLLADLPARRRAADAQSARWARIGFDTLYGIACQQVRLAQELAHRACLPRVEVGGMTFGPED